MTILSKRFDPNNILQASFLTHTQSQQSRPTLRDMILRGEQALEEVGSLFRPTVTDNALDEAPGWFPTQWAYRRPSVMPNLELELSVEQLTGSGNTPANAVFRNRLPAA